ncbi:hypothetical protein LOTGIDRAFT_135934 [Lottia gigantea]|uniref:EF-hand domain-containing protein n=1 Tax=Lottia gigantea TaxID=225164 RepID=V4BAP3_LOTGI|nr:hypothetical protein LOTGIDRAFT_135934 [Lottia gigantea]ESP04581.1 hypothetical protein LOTGIDRAFT_135934 [Lottia gigantea]
MYAEHKQDTQKEKLVSTIRNQCLKNGCGGIKHLSTVFRRMDVDYSKKLCYKELAMGVKSYGMSINDEDLKVLFDILDHDKSGYIDFTEFMHHLRPTMSVSRIQVINEAFNKLDVNNDDELRVDDLKGRFYNIKHHPIIIHFRFTQSPNQIHFRFNCMLHT